MTVTAHNRLTLSGTLTEQSAGDEIWSCSINGFETISPTIEVMDVVGAGPAYLTAIATAVKTWFTSANAYIPSGCSLTQLKVASIGTDGKYTDPPAVLAVTGAAGTQSPLSPSFCCVAVSFTTPQKTGRKGRYGRIYPPNYAIGAAAGSVVGSTGITNLVTSTKALLTAISNSAGPTGQNFVPCVVSQSSVGWEQITGVRVGNVMDVQRRRKDAVSEVYTASAWP
jgi:hypothetical protein